MKSKFMRMVGRGEVSDDEEEEQVFQEEQDKVLPLISDAEIDGFYNKFKELGYESVYTEKREYVLDAYIKMNNFVTYSFPTTLEGSGLLSDLITDISNNQKLLEIKNEEYKKIKDTNDEEKILEVENEMEDIERRLDDYQEQLPIAREQDVEPDKDFINLIYKLNKDIDELVKKRVNVGNKNDALIKQKEEKINQYMIKLKDEYGLDKEIVDYLVNSLSDAIPQKEREEKLQKFNMEMKNKNPDFKPLNINKVLIEDPSYKDVTSARVLKMIEIAKSRVDLPSIKNMLNDLFMSLQYRGELPINKEGDIIKVDEEELSIDTKIIYNEKEANKKKFILTALKYPLVGLLDCDEYGFLNLPDKIVKETFRQKGLYKGEIQVLFKNVEQYSPEHNWFQGYFTEFIEVKLLKNQIIDFIFDIYKEDDGTVYYKYSIENENGEHTTEKIKVYNFKEQIEKYLTKSINSLTVLNVAIFGDVAGIDYEIPIKEKIDDNDENILFYVLIEAKSSEKNLLRGKRGEYSISKDRVYTTSDKLYKLLYKSANEETFKAFHTFHSIRPYYAETIMSGKNKDMKPMDSYIVELYNLINSQGYDILLNLDGTITLTDNEATPILKNGIQKKDKKGNLMYNDRPNIPKTTRLKNGEYVENPKYKSVYTITASNNEIADFLNTFYGDAITGTKEVFFDCQKLPEGLYKKFNYPTPQQQQQQQQQKSIKPMSPAKIARAYSISKDPSLYTPPQLVTTPKPLSITGLTPTTDELLRDVPQELRAPPEVVRKLEFDEQPKLLSSAEQNKVDDLLGQIDEARERIPYDRGTYEYDNDVRLPSMEQLKLFGEILKIKYPETYKKYYNTNQIGANKGKPKTLYQTQVEDLLYKEIVEPQETILLNVNFDEFGEILKEKNEDLYNRLYTTYGRSQVEKPIRQFKNKLKNIYLAYNKYKKIPQSDSADNDFYEFNGKRFYYNSANGKFDLTKPPNPLSGVKTRKKG